MKLEIRLEIVISFTHFLTFEKLHGEKNDFVEIPKNLTK